MTHKIPVGTRCRIHDAWRHDPSSGGIVPSPHNGEIVVVTAYDHSETWLGTGPWYLVDIDNGKKYHESVLEPLPPDAPLSREDLVRKVRWEDCAWRPRVLA